MKGVLEMDPQIAKQLRSIIAKDVEFFRSHNIMDYSLLVGVEKSERYSINENDNFRP